MEGVYSSNQKMRSVYFLVVLFLSLLTIVSGCEFKKLQTGSNSAKNGSESDQQSSQNDIIDELADTSDLDKAPDELDSVE